MTPFAPTTAALLSLLLSFVLPLVVGLVTKASWPAGLKAVLLLALQAVGQLLLGWQAAADANASFDWRGWLYAVGIGFVMSVATHFGLWRPVGAADTAQRMLINDGTSGDLPPRYRR
jgi:hypothetical protein